MLRRSWSRNWIVLAAIVVHAAWGTILLFDDAPLHTTPLGSLPTSNRFFAAIIYLAAAGLAALPVIWKQLDRTIFGLLLTGLQQWLLMTSFWTAVVSVLGGHYPDGYVPNQWGNPRLFIFCDQLWPAVGMISHTLSLLDWYWWSLRKPIKVS